MSDAPNEGRRVSIVRAILRIHLAVIREQIPAFQTETDGRKIPHHWGSGPRQRLTKYQAQPEDKYEEGCIYTHAGRGDLGLRRSDNFSPGKGKANEIYLPNHHFRR